MSLYVFFYTPVPNQRLDDVLFFSKKGIGQCVGARNHKFFLNFCFATSLFTAFILASVLFSIVRSTTTTTDLDTHLIVLLVLAVLFWLFTTSLAVSHTRLIMHGQTTVESMHIRAAQEKEGQTLARGFEWWECGYVFPPPPCFFFVCAYF